MKIASLVLNVILLLAVGYLFIDRFGGEKDGAAAVQEESAASGGPLTVVYINSDSLLFNYDYFRQKQEELASKEETASRGLQARSQQLEQEAARAQQQAQSGDLAPRQIQELQQSLGLKQQQLLQDQQRIQQELLMEGQELQIELEQKLKTLLEAIKKEKGYDYILNYGPGSGVLMVDENHDITRMVVDRLNKK